MVNKTSRVSLFFFYQYPLMTFVEMLVSSYQHCGKVLLTGLNYLTPLKKFIYINYYRFINYIHSLLQHLHSHVHSEYI